MNGECEYIFDGNDTDETKWYRCTTHHELALSPDAPCAGYQEEPYEQPEDETTEDETNNTNERL